MKINSVVLLDDDCRKLVKKFIKGNGLEFLKREFNAEKVIAAIFETDVDDNTAFKLYSARDKAEELHLPTIQGLSVENITEVLEGFEEKKGNLLVLCDCEWALGNQKILNSVTSIANTFSAIKLAMNNMEGEQTFFDKIIIVYYTTRLENNIFMPENIEGIIINQKIALDWSWLDVVSSVSRVKDFLDEIEL